MPKDYTQDRWYPGRNSTARMYGQVRSLIKLSIPGGCYIFPVADMCFELTARSREWDYMPTVYELHFDSCEDYRSSKRRAHVFQVAYRGMKPPGERPDLDKLVRMEAPGV